MADEATTNSESGATKPQADAGSAPGGGAPQTDDVLTVALLAEQLEAAKADRDTQAKNVLLAMADLENYRRRVQKEFEEERKYRALPLVRDFLPVLDNLHRALDAAKTSQDPQQLAQGVQMVAKQFADVLAKNAVLPINAEGKPFDPNLHQAIQQMPAADKPPLTVLNEVEKGYTLHDRVVRPSTVIVTAPATSE